MSHRITDIDTLSNARHQKRSLRQPRNVYDRGSNATYGIISNHSAAMKNPPRHKAQILEHIFLYMFSGPTIPKGHKGWAYKLSVHRCGSIDCELMALVQEHCEKAGWTCLELASSS